MRDKRKQANDDLKTLIDADWRVYNEIIEVTEMIRDHREIFNQDFETLSVNGEERRKFHSWRRTSFQLHRKRAELKLLRERIQIRLLQLFQTDCDNGAPPLSPPIPGCKNSEGPRFPSTAPWPSKTLWFCGRSQVTGATITLFVNQEKI